MRRWFIALAAIACLFGIGRVFADVSYTEGRGTTIFDYVCFVIKHCSAHVPINSSGTEIMTAAAPAQVSLANTGTNATPILTTADSQTADGADVTLGAKADAAAGTGTVTAMAVLKQLHLDLGTLNTTAGSSVAAGTNNIGNVGQISQYPTGAIPLTASATGTTAATTATLAASAGGLKTYLCTMSIRANATAAVTGNATVTGTVTGTLNFTQWTAPLASGLGVTEQTFVPCVPSSAVNTGIAVISAAPGTGGVVSVTATGYQL